MPVSLPQLSIIIYVAYNYVKRVIGIQAEKLVFDV